MKSLSLSRFAVLFASVALLTVAVSPPAKADVWNKKTILTVNEPIQVTTNVLEPGQYVFKLADSQSDRHIVQIFNADETHVIATILAIPNYRLRPTGKSQFMFWETPASEPRALRAWFYPGDNFGQEFAYKPKMIAQAKTTTVTTAAVKEEDRSSENVEIARNVPVAEPEPAPAPEPTPAPEPEAQVTPAPEPTPAPVEVAEAPAPMPTELPKTASNYPLIALLGLLSLAGSAMMTVQSRRA